MVFYSCIPSHNILIFKQLWYYLHTNSILKKLLPALELCTNNGFNVQIIDKNLEFLSIEFCVIINGKAYLLNIINTNAKNHPTKRSTFVVKE